MKRLTIVLATVALAAGVLVALSGVASAREAEPYAAEQAKLPPLPAEIKERKRWNIAVKCDTPPFGYIGARSQHAGFDVEIARWFSRFAFGKSNRVTYTCVTTPAREPALSTGRDGHGHRDVHVQGRPRHAHRLLARLLQGDGSAARAQQLVHPLGADLAGKTVVTTSGSVYDRWMKNCFKDTKVLVTDSFTNALIAFRDGRADALMWDDTVLLGIAVTDRNYKLTSDLFLPLPYGIGIKQGNTALKAWVDSRLNLMKKRDLFFPILKNTVPPAQVAPFSKNILRPKQAFGYTQGDMTTQCP